jgi:hypothetical protein
MEPDDAPDDGPEGRTVSDLAKEPGDEGEAQSDSGGDSDVDG